MRLEYILLADGPSDDVLHHPIRWTLRSHWPDVELTDPPVTVPRRHGDVQEAIQAVVDRFKPDLVIVHRDAERAPMETRRAEIRDQPGVIPIIPVRMTEAWLLIDGPALQAAVARPRGPAVALPRVNRLEQLPDPKKVLEDALLAAAGEPRGRARDRLKRDLPQLKRRVAEHIQDYGPLRGLDAFQAWERALVAALPALRG